MAWKDGFVIEYVPRKKKGKKRKKKQKQKQAQTQGQKHKKKAAETRGGKPKRAKQHKAKRDRSPYVGSVLSVRGLHVGRTVRDRSGKTGRVVSLTSTQAKVEFDDGSTRLFKVPYDFADHEVNIVNVRERKTGDEDG